MKKFIEKIKDKLQKKNISDDSDQSLPNIPTSGEPEIPTGLKGKLLELKNASSSKLQSFLSSRTQSDKDLLSPLKEFSWDKSINKIFAPETRAIIHKGLVTSSIVTGSYMTGNTGADYIKSKNLSAPKEIKIVSAPKKYKFNNFNSITQKNLFNSVEKTQDQMNKKKEAPKKKVNLNILCEKSEKEFKSGPTLLNTIVIQDSVKSIASVQVRGQKDILDIREGDKISTHKVDKIQRLRVIFKNLITGECEFIENVDKEYQKKMKTLKKYKIVSPKKGKKMIAAAKDNRIKNEGNKYTIAKSFKDDVLGNIGEILTQARAIQMKNPDGSLSFKMTDIVKGSVYSKLGVEENDIIQEINGKKFKSLNQLMTLFGNVRNLDNFEIKLRRDGTEVVKEYNFNN